MNIFKIEFEKYLQTALVCFKLKLNQISKTHTHTHRHREFADRHDATPWDAFRRETPRDEGLHAA